MKLSTVARCAAANEVLRRRQHAVCDNITRPGLKHHVELMSVTFEEAQPQEPHTEKERRQVISFTLSLGLRTIGEGRGANTTSVPAALTDSTRTTATIAHRPKSGVWKPILSHDRVSSPVLVALQQNPERSDQSLTCKAQKICTSEAIADAACDDLNTGVAQIHDTGYRHGKDVGSFHFPPVDEQATPNALDPYPYHESSNMSASPESDTTLVEEPVQVPDDSLEDGVNIQSLTVDVFPSQEGASTPTEKRNVRHRRNSSSNSAFEDINPALVPPRSRAKTNDGLLSFKASSFKDFTHRTIKGRHRRKISLNLPVNSQALRPKASPQSKQPHLSSLAEPSYHLQTAPNTTMAVTLSPEERELEYKHRRTFIGTGSLDDFLELLEMSDTYLTTQNAVVRAFVQISSTEQIYARRLSKEPDGWELVSRIKPDIIDVTSIDYVVQLQVKLGSITLRQFLDMIPFDENNQAAAIQVVEAFSAASHMDSKNTMVAYHDDDSDPIILYHAAEVKTNQDVCEITEFQYLLIIIKFGLNNPVVTVTSNPEARLELEKDIFDNHWANDFIEEFFAQS
ncbi:hypothetical protein L13192_04374 [Pyrenophora tritici-repentis]|nr:hypothetical protein L13192_04374 [Pyrenophora tritici-repentis]KAI1684760.1 hypothetical protein KJE20_05044 [Pyrenophora tritici-repentis]